ncbi:MAG: V-type ATPase subunit [Candidatus Helarchaeota archaeon]
MTDSDLIIQYLIPKVSVEFSKLFKGSDYANLLKLNSKNDLIDALLKSKYRHFIVQFKPKTIEEIEFVLEEYLISIFIKFLNSAPPTIQKYLYNEFLFFELQNIKKLIRGNILGYSYKKILSIIHISAEQFLNRDQIFIKLIYSKNLINLIDSINFEFYAPLLSEAFNYYKESNSVYLFDFLLDHEYYKNLINQSQILNLNTRFLHDYIQLEVIIYNILAIMRSKKLDLKPYQMYRLIIQNKIIHDELEFEKLINSKSFNVDIKIIESLFKGKLGLEQINDLNQLYYKLNYFKMDFYYQTAKKREFNIKFPLSVLKLINFEIKNIISILNGIEYNISNDEIQDSLLILE